MSESYQKSAGTIGQANAVEAGNAEKLRDDTEIDSLLVSILERRGLDFREYARSSLRRRIHVAVEREKAGEVPALRQKAQADEECMDRLVALLTVHTSTMFRDPSFFRAVRENLVPVLRTYPSLRFWVAGCSTGEEVYSLAILLEEEGLMERSRIYATDIGEMVVEKARAGIYPMSRMQEFTRNYQQSGGSRSFAEFYTADREAAIFCSALRSKIVFAAHNLAGGASFNEFHAILCRNVIIYFNRRLHDVAHTLLHESLIALGYLMLGRSESIRFSLFESSYETVSARERIYRRIK